MNRQNNKFYWGSRYEYATTLALSAVASAIQVPRPEDYGFDHICTLVELIGINRYPRFSFGVQVKPQTEEELVYGDVIDCVQHDWEVEWLFNRDLPLLIATVALEPTFCINLFSTWNIWHAYWMKPSSFKRKVNLLINKQPERPNNGIDRWKSYPHDIQDVDTYDNCDVYLGHPIVQLTSPTPKPEEAKLVYECLNFWIGLDRQNIQYRKLGIPVMYTVQNWKTNEKPEMSPYQFQFWPQSQTTKDDLLQALAPMIKALEKTFEIQGDAESINLFRGINEIIKKNGHELRDVG